VGETGAGGGGGGGAAGWRYCRQVWQNHRWYWATQARGEAQTGQTDPAMSTRGRGMGLLASPVAAWRELPPP